jgi:hypothetical protein
MNEVDNAGVLCMCAHAITASAIECGCLSAVVIAGQAGAVHDQQQHEVSTSLPGEVCEARCAGSSGELKNSLKEGLAANPLSQLVSLEK